ncbi:hypothetical protein WSM22_01100 [Cytophagales bacterium WSM2-2]|nr:hypothetical protein WSM22_01100 [Cytophagales bacterium WSM2-2]
MRFFAAALIFFGVAASYAQTPQVPHKIRFAGMALTIRDDARREIQKEVDALTKSPRYFNIKVERARTYFPIIEKIFKEEDLPTDFKYLALQESSLVSDAVSTSNAVGFWQFKDFTAQEMGMRVDREIDERMNIVSASKGAARYIKQNNWYFNNWVLALQAYQMGKGGVIEALGDKYNGDSHMEINAETYWYVKKYLAHRIAFEDACEGTPQLKVGLYESKGKKKLSDLAKEFSVEESTLKEHNKWIRSGTIPDDKPYMVAVPGGTIPEDFHALVMSQPKTIEAKTVGVKGEPEADTKFHINGILVIKAKQGETVSALATRAGVNISKFMDFNDIAIDARITPGAYYFTKRKKKKGAVAVYQTRIGDNLWLVSQQQGIRLDQLKKFNPLAKDQIASGVVLRLNSKAVEVPANNDSEVAELTEETFAWGVKPKEAPQPVQSLEAKEQTAEQKALPVGMDASVPKAEVKAEADTIIYEVKSSDTLYGIARQFGATIKEVMEWNNKSNLTISPGEKLKIIKR